MNAFDFFSVARVCFGRGAFDRIGELAGSFGHTAMVVTNAGQPGDGGLVDRMTELLGGSNVPVGLRSLPEKTRCFPLHEANDKHTRLPAISTHPT